MNIRVKAALLTLGILAGCIVIAVSTFQMLSMFTASQVADGIYILFMGFCVYMLYSITLSRLEHQETMKEIEKKSNT